MKAIQKLSMFLGGRTKRRKLAEEVLRSLGSFQGDHLASLPSGPLSEVLALLESHGYPTLVCETAASRNGTAANAPHTVKVQVASRAQTERRTRGGVVREWLYITRLGSNSWTWYAEAGHESNVGKKRS